MTWLVPGSGLSPHQRGAVEARPLQHLLIEGCAGSGKTAVLLHRAAALLAGGIDPKRLRIFTYTNVLKGYLASALDLLGIPPGCVSTFDSWCAEVYRFRVARNLPSTFGHVDYEALHTQVEERLSIVPTGTPILDAALVDEGQDLPVQCYRILQRASRHVTVALDPHQRIFEGGAVPAKVRLALGLDAADPGLRLELNYRSGKELAAFASGFLEDAGERSRFLAKADQAPSIGQKPLVHFAHSEAEESDRLADLVRQRMALGDRVGILLPRTRQVLSTARLLEESGIPVQRALSTRSGPGSDADFGSPLPKLCTYHSAKGLTFDSVLLPRLGDDSFPRDQGPSRRRLLFVGISRASRWAFLGRCAGRPFAEDPWLEEAGKLGRAVLQQGPTAPSPVQVPTDEAVGFF